ncbi:MAG: sensor histidine kinase [Devosia sp.]|nr:sensor histidine kinase [Devosia sp.]
MAHSAGEKIARAATRNARRAHSITLYLFILALVALVPAFIFSAVLLQRNNEAQERVVETLMVGTARSIVQTVEREIAANVTTLRILASEPYLLEGNIGAFHQRVKSALEGTGASIYLLDSDLISIMSTRVDFGTPPTPSADPESGRRALATGDVVASGLVFGAVSKRWVYNVLLPITLPGQQRMILGFNRFAENLAVPLRSSKLPAGWHVALIDSDGTVIAASPGAGGTGDNFALADASNLASSSGWMRLDADGRNYLAAVQRSPMTGWTLIAWAPGNIVAQPLSDAFWSLFVGGILLAATVILVIYWVSLQIGRSVHGLEADAKLLGAGEPVPVRDYPISEIATVSSALAEASRRRQAAEAEVRFLMRELAHRSKNQMTVIAAMAKQTAKNVDSITEFVASFEKRIFGLARSTDLLLAHGIAGVEFRELLTHQIDPFCPVEGGRVMLEGPAFRLNTQAAQILGMAAHELATNAVKYGAFASDTGTLSVTWSIEKDRLVLVWRETVQSMPARSRRRGFGTTVLESMVGRSLGAEVASAFHPDGVEWTFAIPAAALDPNAVPHETAEPEAAPLTSPEPASDKQPAVAAAGEEK